ncbi:type I-E CRISPR-associated protein Cas5/CasD [Nonomuraea sp. NPDC049028]|uniref:type I-E CRISPR-associated protein Cas5/CasD n=1 Tax=Nonomuraea sp. NPDC049028 TaxID=3364348 RepID=UPI00371F37B6
MSDVLVLRLSGPLQSWGGATRYNVRGTLSHPTKSGVIGLCAGALGWPRGTDLSALAKLQFGVRVDRPGRLLIDYHTMSAASHDPLRPQEQRLPTADGKALKPGQGKISRRYYLQDAVFVAALAGDHDDQSDLLQSVEGALRAPRYPMYLGRRSCPPDKPVLMSLLRGTGGLETVLREIVPWQVPEWRRFQEDPLALILDQPDGEELLDDLPSEGGTPFDRKFTHRPVHHDTVDPRSLPAPQSAVYGFTGDAAMSLLDG